MKSILLPLLLILVGLTSATVTPLQKEQQHKAAHTIVLWNKADNVAAGCSATAIYEHVLLTAEHCNIADAVLYLDQTRKPFQHPLEISERYFDHQDHMLLVLPGVSFKNVVQYGATAPLKQGDHYYLFGNPGLLPDQYREGYVTGMISNPLTDDDVVDAVSSFLMLSGPVVGGDSGSAIFSAEDGHLASVLTYGINYGMFAGVYPLAFTSAQIAQAEGLGTFIYLPDNRPVINIGAPAAPQTTDTALLHVAESGATSLLLIALLLALPIIGRVGGVLLCVARWTARRIVIAMKYAWRAAKRTRLILKEI